MIIRPGMDPLYVPSLNDYLAMPPGDPAAIFDPWQADWVNDLSRFKLALKARQGGFSWCETADQVKECVSIPNTPWIDMSRGERQSKELIEKVVTHVRSIDAAIQRFDGLDYRTEEFYCESIAERVTVLTVEFVNGSRIIGLPANEDTARGYTGNVFGDEVAFHRDLRKIKAALVPIITRGYKVRWVSTPNGKGGPYYEMWTDRTSGYSKHRVDVYEMAARGVHLRPDPAELRKAMGDDELFAQEYECAFLDQESIFIPYELITGAESDLAHLDDSLDSIRGDLFVGVDIGRRRDMTVAWGVTRESDGRRVTRFVMTMRGIPFSDQEAMLHNIALRCARMAMDESGLGMMLSENLSKRHPGKIIPLTFTTAEKEQLAVRIKRTLEDRTFLLPTSNMIRSAFHSIKRLPGTGGHFRFDAERTEESGHADAFWAAALAERAAGVSVGKMEYQRVAERSGLSAWLHVGKKKDERFPQRDYGKQRPANSRTAGF